MMMQEDQLSESLGCRGVKNSPIRPISSAAISSIGVTGVLMNALAILPAIADALIGEVWMWGLP